MALLEPELDQAVLASLRELPSPDGRSMVACVAELFAQDASGLVEKMLQAAERQDWAAVGTAAHALKSYAGNVGATVLAQQLRALELAAKAGEGDRCAALLAPIPGNCHAVSQALAREAARP